MTKRYLVIAAAWSLHAASWFLPAIKGFLGSRLDHGIPGWSVFCLKPARYDLAELRAPTHGMVRRSLRQES